MKRNLIISSILGVIAAIMDHLFPGEGKNRYEWQSAPGCGYLADLDRHYYFEI